MILYKIPQNSDRFASVSDEFNRVIIPVKRGEENTDYVNASFIDVSLLESSPTSHYSLQEGFVLNPFSYRFHKLPSTSLCFFSTGLSQRNRAGSGFSVCTPSFFVA